MRRTICGVFVLIALTGCGTLFPGKDAFKPQSSGEVESGYTYIPIDPFSVDTVAGDGCKGVVDSGAGRLLDALPDNAVRMLVEQFNASGTVTYGASKSGAQGESYRVTIDYINADTINVPVWIAKSMIERKSGAYEPVYMFSAPGPEYIPDTEIYEVTREAPKPTNKGSGVEQFPKFVEFNIPVYVGVGLRVSANVLVLGANANISGIGIIGAEAEDKRLRGTLVVQTLGVNGKSVAAALPIQSELNRTTAQNAIVAVGSIKALLYADETIKSPRVVGLYLPFPGGKPLVNALISELSRKRVQWPRPCLTPVKPNPPA
jgi:hypothetical protein